MAQSTAGPTAASPSASLASPVVVVTKPKRVTINWSVDQPASVMAFETTPIMAKLPGFVGKVLVDIGDKVSVGQRLAELDIPELVLEAEQKQSLALAAAAERVQADRAVDVATAGVASAEAMIAGAKAGITRARADADRWQSELRRMEGLAGRGVLDTQAVDEVRKQAASAAAGEAEAEAKVKVAEQLVVEMQAKHARAKADVQAAEARVKVAEAEVKRVSAMLAYTHISAPFAGVVTVRNVHTGHFVQPAAGRPEPLFVVSRQDVLRVFADVPESAADRATVGTAAVVRFPSLGGRDFVAKIGRTSNAIAPETRTLRIEIDLPNPDGALKPGLYASVRLSVSTANALVLPTAAVLLADETAYAYRLDGDKVCKVRLLLGRPDGGMVEVLGQKPAAVPAADWSPLTAEETFVVGNLGQLADGQTVSVK